MTNVGAIVGIVIAIVAVLFVPTLIYIMILKYRAKKERAENPAVLHYESRRSRRSSYE